MFRRKEGHVSHKSFDKRKPAFPAPIDELNYLLDTLDQFIVSTMDDHLESIRPSPPKPLEGKLLQRSSVLETLKHLRSSRTWTSPSSLNNSVVPETPADFSDKKSSPSLVEPYKHKKLHQNREVDARFIAMDSELVDEIVETIRRIAELVVIAERSHDRQESGHQNHSGNSEKNNHNGTTGESNSNENMAIFETFFERQGLATITNILNGVCFDIATHPSIQRQVAAEARRNLVDQSQGNRPSKDSTQPFCEHDLTVTLPLDLQQHNYMLLPPLAIATQAIQSVSILVQNVSKATSLFFILSNNHVNQLIQFPLEEYHIAERRKHNQVNNGLSPRRYASPELAELTTQFVTFLKSLALRMNAETLQFFLTYPPDINIEQVEDIILMDTDSFGSLQDNAGGSRFNDNEDRPMDENENAARATAAPETLRPIPIKTVKLEFPLYERALEFCSAHQDSFVRITAMNICLNTLRLATVTPGDGDEKGYNCNLGKSPDGVLHNARPLPIKERVSIAQYVCMPTRVERMASPIFTKLAQLWSVLEEQFRAMDGPTGATTNNTVTAEEGERQASTKSKLSSEKVARAKEATRRQKLVDSFNDTAYSIQDELLLLEDVMKVGLTSLNEQLIEMMFATFVYPLLLQPLLLYFQRSPVPDKVLFADPLHDHSAGGDIRDSDMTATEQAMISAPAKAALFCLSAAFQFLSNPPLLRLLFTSLFNPLAPEATGATMIRAKADVACLSPDGNVQIRIDPIDEATGTMKTVSNRSSYVFGTITGSRVASSTSRISVDDETSCVFVLTPALSEILEFCGQDAALVARTRHNPYRKAIFQCFRLCSQLSDLRPLSVMAVQAAAAKLPSELLSDVLFGVDLKTFQDTIAVDKGKTLHLSRIDDRDIGGGTTAGQSRMSLGDRATCAIGFDHMKEVLFAFQSSLVKTVPAGRGTWKLEYDEVAAHALLCILRCEPSATLEAAKAIDQRYRLTASFLSEIPKSIERFGVATLSDILWGSGTKQPRDKFAYEGTLMETMFRGPGNANGSRSAINNLVELKPIHRTNQKQEHAAVAASVGSYEMLCHRCCSFPPLDSESERAALDDAMSSADAFVKLGKAIILSCSICSSCIFQLAF